MLRQIINVAASLGSLVVCAVVLHDQENITAIMNMYPYIEPFLFPLLMGGLVASGFYAIFTVPPAVRLLLPGVRWGQKFHERCEKISFEIASITFFDDKDMPELVTTLQHFRLDLEQYRIPCPPISKSARLRTDTRVDGAVKLWRTYLLILRDCASRGDLGRAQKIYDELTEYYQELWDRIEEVEEIQAEDP
ncbi:MAG: hypothetical protein F4201_11195 [Nitrospira sp. SB0677_bin_15]|nr:hypothetical protein [Nitrospira sp. SB0677_bin_15]